MRNKKDDFEMYFEKPKEGISYERLSRALNLILSEDDLKNYSDQTKDEKK